MKEIILSIVKARNAVKAVDLALAVIDRIHPKIFDHEEYHEILDKLVEDGEVERLEYLEPDNGFVNKRALYFPGGTVIVRGLDESKSRENSVVGKSEVDSQISRPEEKRRQVAD